MKQDLPCLRILSCKYACAREFSLLGGSVFPGSWLIRRQSCSSVWWWGQKSNRTPCDWLAGHSRGCVRVQETLWGCWHTSWREPCSTVDHTALLRLDWIAWGLAAVCNECSLGSHSFFQDMKMFLRLPFNTEPLQCPFPSALLLKTSWWGESMVPAL